MDNRHQISIYGRAGYDLNSAYRRAEQDDINEHNKRLIIRYINQHYSKGISEKRCVKLLTILRNLCRMTSQHFDDFTRDDFIQTINRIKSNSKYAESTKEDYVLVLKMLFKWFESEDERIYSDDFKVRRDATLFYKMIRDTKIRKHSKVIEPSEIITESDMIEIMKQCSTVRDRAFVKLLHESGARIEEMLRLEIKDVVFDKKGNARLHIPDCKTGQRRIPLVYSVPYLRTWIDCHPHHHNKNCRLWWTDPKSNRNKALQYRGARKILTKAWETLSKDSPIQKKPNNPHFFRHSRATLLAPHLTSEMLCKFMGWTPASKQARTYVHLSPEDLDKAYFIKMGIEPDDSKNDLVPRVCSICETQNSAVADYCMKCGKPMRGETVVLEDIRESKGLEKNLEKLKALMKNPDIIQLMEQTSVP